MSTLKGACIIGQSGGPTSVINASARGVIETALKNENITQVLAAENGIKGILEDRVFDCGLEDPEELKLLSGTPSSKLGSCRYKLKDSDVDDTDYKRILEIFKKYTKRPSSEKPRTRVYCYSLIIFVLFSFMPKGDKF